jgi:hypothetical protein
MRERERAMCDRGSVWRAHCVASAQSIYVTKDQFNVLK